MSPESREHDKINRLVASKLSEWFGATIREYNMYGHRWDVYSITPSRISIYVEVIWSQGQYKSDMIMLQRSDADVKVIISGPKVFTNKSIVKDYTKFAIIQTREGRVVPPEMVSGERMLQDLNYIDNELKSIFFELISQAEKRTSISKLLLLLASELENNKSKLLKLYSSGGISYLAHTLQTGVWDLYKDRLGEISYAGIETLTQIYHNIRILNQSIIPLMSMVDRSAPPFPELRKLRDKTSENIDTWMHAQRERIKQL